MYTSRRQSGTRWLLAFVLGAFLSTGLLLFLALNSEAINRRIEAIPYYMQTYANKFRPNVEMPPPPTMSDIAPEALLQTSPNNETQEQSTGNTPAGLR